jgi:hypothetical protein
MRTKSVHIFRVETFRRNTVFIVMKGNSLASHEVIFRLHNFLVNAVGKLSIHFSVRVMCLRYNDNMPNHVYVKYE